MELILQLLFKNVVYNLLYNVQIYIPNTNTVGIGYIELFYSSPNNINYYIFISLMLLFLKPAAHRNKQNVFS